MVAMHNGGTERYSQNYRRRDFAARYLKGDGIEIGGLHNPLNISGLPITRIRRVDRYDLAGLQEHYHYQPEDLITVDIVDDGQVLSTIADDSLDFIVANHLIEHCDNPIGTLKNWLGNLKMGGTIFMAVPDKRVGYEERRPLTPLSHIAVDYFSDSATRKKRNRDNYEEWVDYFEYAYTSESTSNREERVRHLIDTDYSIHFHVFTFESFREMVLYARDTLGFPLRVVDTAYPERASWESLFILEKCDDHERSLEAPDTEQLSPETLLHLRTQWQDAQIESNIVTLLSCAFANCSPKKRQSFKARRSRSQNYKRVSSNACCTVLGTRSHTDREK